MMAQVRVKKGHVQEAGRLSMIGYNGFKKERELQKIRLYTTRNDFSLLTFYKTENGIVIRTFSQ